MKKLLFAFLLALTLCPALCAQQVGEKQYALYGVGFYNLENLFDTIHDAGKNDYEFLPHGSYHWNTLKYRTKVRNLAKVLGQLCTDRLPNVGAGVIGVSEVENARCLDDLVAEEPLRRRGYRYVHVEGPDRRGVDCAFLYNPRFFRLETYYLVPFYYKDPAQPDVDLGFTTDAAGRVVPYPIYPLRGDTSYVTRGFLVMTGQIADEKIHFIVCHLPSRGATSPARERGAYQLRALKDALLRQDPDSKVIIMGDMNDDPRDKSISQALGARHRRADVTTPQDLYNPWWDTLYKVGQGSLLYDGKWNLFDQIILSGGFLADRKTLTFYENRVFLRDYLLQQEGRNKGVPLRTTQSGVWLGGYSDHLPTYIYLIKEKQ